MNTNRAKMSVALALVVEFEMKSVMLRVKIAAWKSSWQLQEPTRALIWCLSRISMTLTNLWITSRIRDPSLSKQEPTLICPQTSRLRPKGSLPFHVHHLPQAYRWEPQTQLKAPRAASNFLRSICKQMSSFIWIWPMKRPRTRMMLIRMPKMPMMTHKIRFRTSSSCKNARRTSIFWNEWTGIKTLEVMETAYWTTWQAAWGIQRWCRSSRKSKKRRYSWWSVE